jgi:hypothetical protein
MSTAEERMSTWRFECRQPGHEPTGSARVERNIPTRPMTARTESTSYSRASTEGDKGRPRTGKGSLLLTPSCSQASTPRHSRPQTALTQRGRASILRHSLTKKCCPLMSHGVPAHVFKANPSSLPKRPKRDSLGLHCVRAHPL